MCSRLLHRQYIIWRAYYGCYLQALQCHLGWKRITGNPEKKNPQLHHKFLLVDDTALRRHRLCQWKDSCNGSILIVKPGESQRETLLRIDRNYEKYCIDLETSLDEPSRACA